MDKLIGTFLRTLETTHNYAGLLAISLTAMYLMAVVTSVVIGMCYRLLIALGAFPKPDQQAAGSMKTLLWKALGGSIGGTLATWMLLKYVVVVNHRPLVLETLPMLFALLVLVGATSRWILGLVGLRKFGEDVGTSAGFAMVIVLGTSLLPVLLAEFAMHH